MRAPGNPRVVHEDLLRAALPGADWRFNEPASRLTTLRVGGPVDALLLARSPEEIIAARALARERDMPFAVFGNGSNMLVRDGGLRGVAVKLAAGLSGIAWTDRGARVGAGASLPALARGAVRRGLDLTWACGIPGTLGGALVMNAGAYGGQIADAVRSVRVLDESGAERVLGAEELNFSYRHSVFCARDFLALEAVLALAPGDPAALTERADELLRARAEKQPLEYPSAGSFFKRPEGDFASRLIDAAGLKGLRVGGAEVSEKHAGFLVNRGGATARDFLQLAERVSQRVYESSGIRLEPEVRIIGEEAS